MALSQSLRRRLAAIRHVALDLDGTIYKGGTLFPQTLPFLACLARLGIGHTFLTNNPSKSRQDYVAALARMGIGASREQVYTTVHATLDYLRRARPETRRVFLFGTASMAAELSAAGYVLTADDPGDEPDAVIVAFDPTLTYAKLGRAAWWINAGKPFIATNPDRVCPTDQPTVLLDCGAICSALQAATGRAPDVVLGKPDPAMLQGIMERENVTAQELAMAGDRIYTDLAMAAATGALGVLVLTGESTAREAAAAVPPPGLTLEHIGALGVLLEESRAPQTLEPLP